MRGYTYTQEVCHALEENEARRARIPLGCAKLPRGRKNEDEDHRIDWLRRPIHEPIRRPYRPLPELRRRAQREGEERKPAHRFHVSTRRNHRRHPYRASPLGKRHRARIPRCAGRSTLLRKSSGTRRLPRACGPNFRDARIRAHDSRGPQARNMATPRLIPAHVRFHAGRHVRRLPVLRAQRASSGGASLKNLPSNSRALPGQFGAAGSRFVHVGRHR